MDEQLEFMKLIALRLDSSSIPYMITGSMAMTIYSIPRMTRDIDLVVEVTSTDVDKIVSIFSDDCYIDQDSVVQSVNTLGMFNIIHSDWVVKADFVIRKNENYRREEFSRRRKIDVEDITISVVAAEDLILSKLVWGQRSQSDLQFRDVCQVLSSVSELDWEYMQNWADVLGVGNLLRKAKKSE